MSFLQSQGAKDTHCILSRKTAAANYLCCIACPSTFYPASHGSSGGHGATDIPARDGRGYDAAGGAPCSLTKLDCSPKIGPAEMGVSG